MKRVAIYAHYDARGEVKRYVLHALRCLREECDEVHFVSTAILPPAELDKVRAHCATARTRENTGLDFMMWRSVLDELSLEGVDELLLTNSSVFGPMRSFRDAFERMADRPCDFWGLTDSWLHTWHLQSYFLVFRRSALEHEAFARFWQSVLPYRDKSQVIRSYELGLSTWLTGEGLRGAALVEWERLRWGHAQFTREVHERPILNAASCLPFECFLYGMPVVKVEIFRDNPGQVPLRLLRRAMEDRGYDTGLIEV